MSSSMVSKLEEHPKSSDIYYLEIAYPFGYVIFLLYELRFPRYNRRTMSLSIYFSVQLLPSPAHRARPDGVNGTLQLGATWYDGVNTHTPSGKFRIRDDSLYHSPVTLLTKLHLPYLSKTLTLPKT